jgi:predicted component of type VI protein secretion system
MADEKTNPGHKTKQYEDLADEMIASIGQGTSFEQVKVRLVSELGRAHADGAESIADVDATQLDLRQTLALERIADHLGAFRRHNLDEKLDPGKVRELLAACREKLRHPRMQAEPAMLRRIEAVLLS